MAQPGAGRRRAVAAWLDAVATWAAERADVRAVALAGSWARNTPHAGSDVDLVLLTRRVDADVGAAEWTAGLGAVDVPGREDWGAVQAWRVRLEGGPEAELGVAAPTWACTSPLDPGTARVARDGLVALHDPDGPLRDLLAAVGDGR